EADTQGDFLVIAAQTGKKWGGYSPRNACWEIEHGGIEFPLEPWTVGHILLTNPKRLEKSEHLIIDCPGVEYVYEPAVGSGLYFGFAGDRLLSRRIDYAVDSCGSGSGFLW
ncbi:MAG TPA: hypothetical protein PLD54_04050, partial [Candidatus Levybacteria bacterium]|nr:hypothetical protein [Candidatus Levybacteria bacterium]